MSLFSFIKDVTQEVTDTVKDVKGWVTGEPNKSNVDVSFKTIQRKNINYEQKCPKCGQISRYSGSIEKIKILINGAPQKDRDGSDATEWRNCEGAYFCKCGYHNQGAFAGYCHVCKKNVGFLHLTITDALSLLGKKVGKIILKGNSLSTGMGIEALKGVKNIYDRYEASNKEPNRKVTESLYGICPFCKNYHIYCDKCNTTIPIEKLTSNSKIISDYYTCPNCNSIIHIHD
jgi:hypothetical protein